MKRSISRRVVLLVSLVISNVSCPATAVPPAHSEQAAFRQWTLPDRLREISGLALTADERLLAVADEKAIVYELDYKSGRVTKAFAFGEPTVLADFEGITVLHNRVWLMTSDGVLYSATEGKDGEHVNYDRYPTRLGDECEFEGLTDIESRGVLLMICKNSKHKLKLYELTPGSRKIRSLVLPEKIMGKSIGKNRVNPSGFDIDPATGDMIILASAQRAIFRISVEGEFIAVVMHLETRRHRQAEGISITADGRMLIADEGAASTKAKLAIYPLLGAGSR